jgi:hypothetical protein
MTDVEAVARIQIGTGISVDQLLCHPRLPLIAGLDAGRPAVHVWDHSTGELREVGIIGSDSADLRDVPGRQALAAAFVNSTTEAPDGGILEGGHLVITDRTHTWEQGGLQAVTNTSEQDPVWLRIAMLNCQATRPPPESPRSVRMKDLDFIERARATPNRACPLSGCAGCDS